MLFTFRKSGTCFHAKTPFGFGIRPIVIKFLCTIFLCVFRQLDGIRLSSKSFIPHISSASFTLSLPHNFVWNMRDLPSCSLVRYDYKYDLAYTPTEIWAVKYKHWKTVYFLSAFQ